MTVLTGEVIVGGASWLIWVHNVPGVLQLRQQGTQHDHLNVLWAAIQVASQYHRHISLQAHSA